MKQLGVPAALCLAWVCHTDKQWNRQKYFHFYASLAECLSAEVAASQAHRIIIGLSDPSLGVAFFRWPTKTSNHRHWFNCVSHNAFLLHLSPSFRSQRVQFIITFMPSFYLFTFTSMWMSQVRHDRLNSCICVCSCFYIDGYIDKIIYNKLHYSVKHHRRVQK